MGSPSLEMTLVLKAVKSRIQAHIVSADETVEIAPALVPAQYTAIKYTVCPADIVREYTDAQDGSDTAVIPRCVVRVWASVGLVGGVNGSFEHAVVGIDAGDDSCLGVCAALERVEGILRDYFLADQHVRRIRFEYDRPTFMPVEAANNKMALAGSFTLEVTGSMAAAPETPMMFGTRTMAMKVPFVHDVETEASASEILVTWKTNFPATSFVVYSEGEGNPLAESTPEDVTLRTEHSVTITGLLSDTRYDLRPSSRDPGSTRVGQSHERYGVTTLRLAPVLVSGPVASNITHNSARITWTVDRPAYHRVRWVVGGGAWTVTGWSALPTTDAVVDLAGLPEEGTLHVVDVQSCAAGDGSAAFDWYPGDGTFGFATLCSGVWIYTNMLARKDPVTGYLVLSWNTNVGQTRFRLWFDWGDFGPEEIEQATSGTLHSYTDTTFRWRDGFYTWKVKCRNRCLVWDPAWSADRVFEVRGGEIV